MKPNIFNYATGELTNDAMICWMLDWANSDDERYKNLSQDILRLFTGDEDLYVESVKIKRQYKNIDIIVEINNSHVIVIEDKVYTSHHSNQLERYREIIESSEEYNDYNKHYVYYKIGNECSYNGVEQAKYKRISRDAILNVIKRYIYLGNNLLNDYIDYLEDMETTFNMYKSEDDINKWYWQTWEGYYNHLQVQKNIEEFCWNFVSNPKGGFLAFFWNWKELKYIKDNREIDYLLYPQIESNSGNSDGDKTKLAFKLKCEDADYRKEIRNSIYGRLEELLRQYISIDDIRKPKFKDGLHMTIVEIKNINTRTKLDEVIKLSEKCIDEIEMDI